MLRLDTNFPLTSAMDGLIMPEGTVMAAQPRMHSHNYRPPLEGADKKEESSWKLIA